MGGENCVTSKISNYLQNVCGVFLFLNGAKISSISERKKASVEYDGSNIYVFVQSVHKVQC